MITGKTIKDLGYEDGKWFNTALSYLKENPLYGDDLIDYLDSIKPADIVTIEPFKEPLPFFWNMDSKEGTEEYTNSLQVLKTMEQVMRTPTVIGGAVMPDACPTGENGQIPVGGVVVTRNSIHPSMHSSDMCCSVFATNMGKMDPKKVLDAANGITQFGPGKRKGYTDWSNILLDNKELYEDIISNYFTKDYIEKALTHIGTQGDGNHFLFVGISENTGDTWMVTHHGSRGFGASVYKKGMDIAEKYRKKLSPNTLKANAWIPYEEIEGKLYWDAIQIIRRWTKLNHSAIHNKVLNFLKIPSKDTFWNEHNSVFKDGDLFYHAKGATPLLDKFVPDSYDGRRLIPLNMAEPILIVKGNLTENNLGFAPHGAGRNISRSQHKRNKGKDIEKILKSETNGLDIRFYSGKPDISELPSAYKNAKEVQKQIEYFNLGTVLDRIMPFGCIMAGEFEKHWKK